MVLRSSVHAALIKLDDIFLDAKSIYDLKSQPKNGGDGEAAEGAEIELYCVSGKDPVLDESGEVRDISGEVVRLDRFIGKALLFVTIPDHCLDGEKIASSKRRMSFLDRPGTRQIPQLNNMYAQFKDKNFDIIGLLENNPGMFGSSDRGGGRGVQRQC